MKSRQSNYVFSGLILVAVLVASIAAYFSSFTIKKRNITVEKLDTLIVVERADVKYNPSMDKQNPVIATSQKQSNKNLSHSLNTKSINVKSTSGKGFNRGVVVKVNIDTLQMILSLAEQAFQQKDYERSLALYKQARTNENTAIDRSEIVKECIYGEAKCLREMRLKGIAPR